MYYQPIMVASDVHRSDESNGYYDLLVAIVVQAINDYLWVNRQKTTSKRIPESERMEDEDLDIFLHCMFSDEIKINAIKRRAKELRESGATNLRWNNV